MTYAISFLVSCGIIWLMCWLRNDEDSHLPPSEWAERDERSSIVRHRRILDLPNDHE